MKFLVPKSSFISLSVMILLLYCFEYWTFFNKEVTVTIYTYIYIYIYIYIYTYTFIYWMIEKSRNFK